MLTATWESCHEAAFPLHQLLAPGLSHLRAAVFFFLHAGEASIARAVLVMAQTERDEFKPGDHVSWKYGVGKATGRIIGKVTEDTKLGGRTFRATPDDPKYRMLADKTGKEVVRRGAVLSRIEESAEAADEKYDSRGESEHTDDSDEEKAAHKGEAEKAGKSGRGGALEEAKKDADEGSKEPTSAGSPDTRSQDHGAPVTQPTIKAGLVTGSGGDEALVADDDTLDLMKRSVQPGADEASKLGSPLEKTVDAIPMEEESAWQLANQNEPVVKGVASEEQESVGQRGGEQETSQGSPAAQTATHRDSASAALPHRLPHEEVPQPAQFSTELLLRSSD